MIFSSYSFLFIFLPLLLVLYFGMAKYVTHKVQQCFLIVASLIFYSALFFEGFNHLWYIWLILTSIAVNYTISIGVQSTTKDIQRRFIFITGILFNVGLLGYYKYSNFFIENINNAFETQFNIKYIILPIGISFFTFQQIAYLISIWKKEEKVPKLLDYTLFIAFFPQLVAGPIVFLQDVLSQYKNEKNRFFNLDNFSKGLFLFAIGVFKKAVIADSIEPFAFSAFYDANILSFGSAWLGSLAYTLQIFFDFSGYSDMAIGLGKMFNINLPVNFYSPYKSKSITEFWKRWHITLGRSLAVLVYYPLGGNRKGVSRTCLNLFLVFFVSGIWHGAAWTFIVWGIAHGIVRLFEKLFDSKLNKIPSSIRIFFTFIFVNAAWVLFRSSDINQALTILKKMFFPDKISFDGISGLAFNTSIVYPKTLAIIYVVTFIGGLLALVFTVKKNSIDRYNEFKPTIKNAIITAILLSISIVHFSRVGAFIYFNF